MSSSVRLFSSLYQPERYVEEYEPRVGVGVDGLDIWDLADAWRDERLWAVELDILAAVLVVVRVVVAIEGIILAIRRQW